MRLSAAIAVPASAGVALVADDMVAALLGPKWLPAIPLLRLLCPYAAVRAIEVLLPPVRWARHQERFLFWYYLVQFVAVPSAAVLGALWDGAPGVVITSTPVYCAIMAVMAKETLAESKGSFSELCSEIWPILAATAAMVAVILLLRQFASTGQADLRGSD